MKTTILLGTLALSLWCSGCATHQRRPIAIAPVGPSPDFILNADSENGALIVYSAYLRVSTAPAKFDEPKLGTYHRYRADYDLLSNEGHWLQAIENNNGAGMWNEPKVVQLAPGKYRIRAFAKNLGYVTVPVVVAAGKVTVVQLGAGPGWPNPKAMTKAKTVRLPRGGIAGWAAPAEPAKAVNKKYAAGVKH